MKATLIYPADDRTDSPHGSIICKWRGDKQSAYSFCADDSINSHLDYMAPALLKRGFVGTFWVNPGTGASGEQDR